MTMFKEVDINTFDLKIFNKLNKEWALLSAGNKDAFNTMTISWGEMGTLWNKPVITCFVRSHPSLEVITMFFRT